MGTVDHSLYPAILISLLMSLKFDAVLNHTLKRHCPVNYQYCVAGAPLVKGIPFDPTDSEICGVDIFQKLVPMEAHEAASVYRYTSQ